MHYMMMMMMMDAPHLMAVTHSAPYSPALNLVFNLT